MVADPEDLESRLLMELEKDRGVSGRTVVAFCVK